MAPTDTMPKKFIYFLFLLWGSLMAANSSIGADDLEQSGLARVKVELLPVQEENSQASQIVKTLKKGDVVKVQLQMISSEGNWCSIIAKGESSILGFVPCDGLEYLESPPQSAQQPREDLQPSPHLGSFLQALWKEDSAAVRDLLEKGIDPNSPTSYGTRPLMLAAKLRDSNIIKLLLRKGADIHSRDSNGMTALMTAASAGRAENTEVLIEAGADLEAKDDKGFTAVMWATVQGHPEIVEILLANGAEVNARTKEGQTALWLSKNIWSNIRNSLARAQKTSPGKSLSDLQEKLAKYESVYRMLLEFGGKE